MPMTLGGWLNSPARAAAPWLTRPGRALVAGMPSSSAWFTAAGWTARTGQWAAATQPEASRAEPATSATATRASLFHGARELGGGLRSGAAGVMGGVGDDRGGFRCRAAVRDTISFPSGAAGALNFHPAAGPVGTPRQRRADPGAGSRRQDRGRHHTLGAVDPPGCTTWACRRAGTTQDAGPATRCRFLSARLDRPSAGPVLPCRAGAERPAAGP